MLTIARAYRRRIVLFNISDDYDDEAQRVISDLSLNNEFLLFRYWILVESQDFL